MRGLLIVALTLVPLMTSLAADKDADELASRAMPASESSIPFGFSALRAQRSPSLPAYMNGHLNTVSSAHLNFDAGIFRA